MEGIKEFERYKNELLMGVQRCISTAFLHQKTFGEFKNKYVDKTVVLVGAGPTLNYFEPIANAIYVGVNRTFLYEKIMFDYLFAIDKNGLEPKDESFTKRFLDYRGSDCTKFVGDQNCGINMQIPEGKLLNNIKKYNTTANLMPSRFTVDIDSEPLGNFHSVSFQAMQFILFTNPSTIYLVGMDSNVSTMGHFTGKFQNSNSTLALNSLRCINHWKELRGFKEIYYPDTEIISVNPVGLKGIFSDVYTENYLLSKDKSNFDEDFASFLNVPMKAYLDKMNFSSYFEEIKKKVRNSKVIIYGTGTLFESVFKVCKLSDFNIIALTDKKYATVGKNLEDYLTIPPEQIGNYKPDYILVAVQDYENIIEDLELKWQVKVLPLVKKGN